MSLAGVEEARARMLACVTPLPMEIVPLDAAAGRFLGEDVRAGRDQPPFPASSMDGWAVKRGDAHHAAGELLIVGESAAGHGWQGRLGPGQAVRISTGAPVPEGADCIVIQEEAVRDGDRVRLGPLADAPDYIRPQGADFGNGDMLLREGERLDGWSLGLAAAAGRHALQVRRKPVVAIASTGDEVAAPGIVAGPWQIYDSAGIGIAALCGAQGAVTGRDGVLRDSLADITEGVIGLECDLIVTIGGASVGDHDHVKPALRELGLDMVVEGVAVRPGKPTWFGTLPDGRLVLGLPGNVVSAMVCAELFLKPLLAALQGSRAPLRFLNASLAGPIPANGPREHYMRARVEVGADGLLRAAVASDQDSSLVSILAASGGLVRRPPHAEAAEEGDMVEILLLDRMGTARAGSPASSAGK